MCKEKQKLKTTFQFHTQSLGEQTREFEYQTLDPVNLRQEVEAANLSAQ